MKPERIITHGVIIGIATALLGLTLPAQATLRSWTGAAPNDSDWSNSFNWAANGLPVAGDDLEFPDGGQHPNNNNDFPAGRTFNSIAFFHGGSGGNNHGYVITGNSIALNAGISVFNNSINSWPIAISNAFSLNSNQTFTVGTLTSLAVSGSIDLNGKDLTVDTASGSQANLMGVISGAGGLIKTNSGALMLWSNNTYTGTTVLSGGLLEILGSQPASSILLNAGTLHARSAVGNITAIGTNGPGTIVLSPGGNAGSLTCSNLALNASTTFVADLIGPAPGSGYDQVNVNGTVALSNATFSVALQYAPSVGTTFIIINNDGSDAISGTFSGLPEGSSLTNNGVPLRISYTGGDGNDVVLTVMGSVRNWNGGGANSFWTTPANWAGGVAPIPGDDLVFPAGAAQSTASNNFPAGTAFNSITISGPSYSFYGSNIVLHAGLNVTNNTSPTHNFYIPLTLDADQTVAIDNANVVLFLYGDINTGGKNLTFAGGGMAQVPSVISGGGGFIKAGDGIAEFYASNTFSGPVQILKGRVITFDGHALGDPSGNTMVSSNATLGLGGINTVAEPIVLAGVLQSSGEVVLTGPLALSGSNATIRVATGNTLTINGVVSGNPGFTKIGQGILTLNANNTYTGLTFLNGGALLVNGSQPNSPIFIYSDTFLNAGTLGGTGTVGTLSLGGPFSKTISPGNSGPGILTFSHSGGDSSTIFAMELNGTTPGSGYDQLQVNGSFSLDNSALSLLLGFTPALGDNFVIIKKDGGLPIVGTFAGLPQGALITNGPTIFRISYTGGDGNDMTLTTTLGAPPATLSSIVSLSNRFEQLTGQGLSNLTYTIQAATNLNPVIQWSNIGALVANSNGVFSFIDTNATLFPVRFYRAVSP